MGDFPSGQRGQTVNLLAMPSVVRIHHPPPKQKHHPNGWCFLFWYGYLDGGFERRLLATVRWTVATAVASPQRSESVLPIITTVRGSSLCCGRTDDSNPFQCNYPVDSCLMRARPHQHLTLFPWGTTAIESVLPCLAFHKLFRSNWREDPSTHFAWSG